MKVEGSFPVLLVTMSQSQNHPQASKPIIKPTLECIGKGACGSVWAISSYDDIDFLPSSHVIKRGDGSKYRSVSNEQLIQTHLLSKLRRISGLFDHSYRVDFPEHKALIQPDSPAWSVYLPGLPSGYSPCQALVNERIMPAPRAVRRLLVQKFWNVPEDQIVSILDDRTNDHCLIRPYLGRRRTETKPLNSRLPKTMRKNLRNFPLHIDQMEELGLAVGEYAMAMADALAFMFWIAEVDACDVEFVLARPCPSSSGHSSTRTPASQPHLGNRKFNDGVLGLHTLWVLDFDCCQRLLMDMEGVEHAAEKFVKNDPYYPRPSKNERDMLLWKIFKRRFLRTSEAILLGEKTSEGLGRSQFPGLLIKRIEEKCPVKNGGLSGGDYGENEGSAAV